MSAKTSPARGAAEADYCEGLAGTVLGLAAGLLVLFQSMAVLSGTQVVLNLPIAVQEMVLAVWLIVKGFSLNAKAKPKAPAPTAELHPA